MVVEVVVMSLKITEWTDLQNQKSMARTRSVAFERFEYLNDVSDYVALGRNGPWLLRFSATWPKKAR